MLIGGAVAVVVWIACSVFAYGVIVASLQAVWRQCPGGASERLWRHRRFAALIALFGPCAVIAVLGDIRNGWRL